MEILRTENLTRIYREGLNKVNALVDANISIKQGEFVAIMGPSGSGKSTLLNLLGGLDRPTYGKVIINGKNIYSLSENQRAIFRRREIGFIFQFYNLIPVITVKENIEMPLLLDNKQIDKTYLNELLKLLKIRDKLSSFPGSLSGGEMQRASIARALITKPSIILADEPTGNLDTKTGKEVINLLRLSVKKYHQTLIMITHDPSIAVSADRVIKLVDGKVIGDDK